MGRRAKYWTNEERLKARRERRASKASTAQARAVKSEENRRYYRKKCGLKLLKEPTQVNEEPIRVLAAAEISSPTYQRLFVQFREGRDNLGFDELDLEEDDFERLSGLPPYPVAFVSANLSDEEWRKVQAALHGFATQRYLGVLDELFRSSVNKADYELIYDLLEHREQLGTSYDALKNAHQEVLQSNRYVEGRIVEQNIHWHCRLLEYNWEDIKGLKESGRGFTRMISERRWALGRVGQEI
ncbi:hypothetical protein NMY22_g16005 [Coprinellus aureogranulatus]|nr:hypothetical protein NMY22_g16005 [Coprinellus aureogranulatus]